jgi:hypothetical protein
VGLRNGWMGGRRNGWAVCEVKTKGFIKTKSLGWIGGRRERARGEHRFSSLVKQKKKEKNYAVFYFTGKRIFFVLYL